MATVKIEREPDPMNEPAGYGPPSPYGQPQPYGEPAPTSPYGQPHIYGQPAPASPYSDAPLVPVIPHRPSGDALQPYVPAAAAPYAPPHPPGPVAGYSLVSAGERLGAALLDFLLGLVTLGIGWLIWAMITWADGQTPAKKLLGHVVADPNTGQPFDWGRMFLREFCVKGLLGGMLNFVSLSIYFWVDSFMVFGDRQRTAHDRMANSIVRHL